MSLCKQATMKPTLVLLFALAWLPSLALADHHADKPNVIFIMADDLGYGDLGCFRPDKDQDTSARPDGCRRHETDTVLCRDHGVCAFPLRAHDRTTHGTVLGTRQRFR